MVALRAADADRFLAKPQAAPHVILFYGPDPGGVSERAAMLTERLVGGDPLAVVRLEGDEVAGDSGRLADEVFGGSLFSGRRVVRLRAGGRPVVAALQPILERPPEDAWLIVEAGDLRKGAPLRRLCEDSPVAAAVGCYPDNDAALGRMIDEEVTGAGLVISDDARHMLIGLIGADRAASRSEIRKLCLYAASSGAIGPEDVAAVIGDGAAFAIDGVVDAAFLGDPAAVDRGVRRLLAAGTLPSAIATAAERHVIQLHRLHAAIDRGATAAGAIHGLRPPALPSRRHLLEQQLRRWSGPDLDGALARLGQAVTNSRLHPANGAAVVGEVLAAIARRAGRRPRVA